MGKQSAPESYDLAVKNLLPTLSVSEHSGTFICKKPPRKSQAIVVKYFFLMKNLTM